MSLFQWPFPKYREHTAQVTDIFPTKMESDAVFLTGQNFSLSVFQSIQYIIRPSWVNIPT